MKNEILEELWRHRDEFAREHNYDLDAMVAALQEMEKRPLTRTVDRRRQRPAQSSNPRQKKSGGG